jgi:PhnB protein
MIVQSYLSFEGRCEEALEFYQRAVGAKVEMLMRFKESPEPMGEKVPANTGDKVMHCAFRIGETTVMASDGYAKGKPEFKGFALSLAVKSEAEAEKVFSALSAGGQVTMPLAKTFWSPRFGMLLDKFGVCWMVNVVL